MFDTMTLTKIAGGLFGAWLILLLGKWAAEEIYHAEAHGEQSYVIEVAGGEAEPEEEIDFAAMMAEADVDKGAKVFKKCTACHKVEDGVNAVGPHLYAVVDRDIAAVDGFGYSGALTGLEGAWTPENLSGFLESPKNYAPGTTMGFAGLKKPTDRANVIAYLQSIAN
ncbi:cytochrome c family protein [Sulfitobacter mediterraneus]|jgi:cytochrome c|uniref:Cytochrome C n=1 Tax=Sulfitobacter mediterraneus TaxID=83219 RepID=A0A061SS07_9RHOB|nr:cytochrome c family protein [Sulfitobacter mediterraneus]KAJ04501.1 cytochrome C [Sulfitobacter mediterraneus]KIN78453.1 Cytochrome c, class I [Sulfitobacter mediterraneus KCTC 32188]MBM1555725.1 cytochrome c family protein [Sulfitobacter mediterraneus]MBM1566722.1 cytochrome c family protein [Sulfitobacter mediterraneus]MBM1570524.1 cytochrome c family protein [Sulfitobacter mediterraneus]